jgi:Bacterial regulatory proteins, tetR family
MGRMTKRRRLVPDERRNQLLDIGAREFATRAYDEVRMADVASRAGVSRALVYRYFPTKRDLFAANQGPLSGDPAIQAIISEELSVIRRRMLDALGLQGHQRAVASAALAGWLSFVRTVCVEWLAQQALSRDELRDMCLRTLANALDDHLLAHAARSQAANHA